MHLIGYELHCHGAIKRSFLQFQRCCEKPCWNRRAIKFLDAGISIAAFRDELWG